MHTHLKFQSLRASDINHIAGKRNSSADLFSRLGHDSNDVYLVIGVGRFRILGGAKV